MSQKNSNSSRIDRRSLLQAVGTAGVIGATGLGATNTVSASDQSEVFDISSREATTKDYENLEQHTDTSNLLESITDRGFTVGFEHAQAADVEAIDSLPAEFEENEVTANEFNDINPRVLFIPCAKSETELGLIVTTVANTEDGDEAVPINAFATVSEEIQSSSDSEQYSEMKVDTLAFEAKDTPDTSSLRPASTSQSEDRTVQTISSTKKTVTPQSTSDSGLSTAQSIGPIGPPTCLVVVTEACDKYGESLTRRQCIGTCLRQGRLNPGLTAACGGFCLVVAEAVDRYGCNASGQALCNSIFALADTLL